MADSDARALHARVRCRRSATRTRPVRSLDAGRRHRGADASTACSRWTPRPYLVDDLIAKIDIATMAHALEARSPFLDHELMELAARDPGRAEGRGGREEVDPPRGARPVALRRDPRPWQAGIHGSAGEWLRTDLRDWTRDILLDWDDTFPRIFRRGRRRTPTRPAGCGRRRRREADLCTVDARTVASRVRRFALDRGWRPWHDGSAP